MEQQTHALSLLVWRTIDFVGTHDGGRVVHAPNLHVAERTTCLASPVLAWTVCHILTVQLAAVPENSLARSVGKVDRLRAPVSEYAVTPSYRRANEVEQRYTTERRGKNIGLMLTLDYSRITSPIADGTIS